MFLRVISYTLIVTLTTSFVAPVWASAVIARHYATRMDDYNVDFTRQSIGVATTEINRIFESAPSEKKAAAKEKRQIVGAAMQTSIIHGTNAFLHRQTHTDVNYYLSPTLQTTNHFRILYAIGALSYTYANILRHVSDADLMTAYGQFDTTEDAFKSLLMSGKGRANFDGYTTMSGISGTQFDEWFIDEFLKVNEGMQKDSARHWWQSGNKISVAQSISAKPVLKSAAHTALSSSTSGGVLKKAAVIAMQKSAQLKATQPQPTQLKVVDAAAYKEKDAIEPRAIHHEDAFAKHAFNPLAMPTFVQNNFIRAFDMMPNMGDDATIYSFLFNQTPAFTRTDYGILGELSSYLVSMKTQRDERTRGFRSPGLLGLPTSDANQRGTTYNFSHEEIGEPVIHPEAVQNFIDDATTAFQNGYISYAGLIRNGKLALRPNESPSNHYTVLFVTKNPKSSKISGVYAIDPGKKGGDEDERTLSAYTSVIIPLNEVGESQGWIGYSPFDVRLQSGNTACGLTAILIAQHLISLNFDAVSSREKMDTQIAKLTREYGDKQARETAFAEEVIHTFKEFYDRFQTRFEPLLDGHPDQIETHNTSVMERNAITLKQCIDEYVNNGVIAAAAYDDESVAVSVSAAIPAKKQAMAFQFIDTEGNIKDGGSKGTTMDRVMEEYINNGYQRALQSVYPTPTTPRNPTLDAEVRAKLAEIGITE